MLLQEAGGLQAPHFPVTATHASNFVKVWTPTSSDGPAVERRRLRATEPDEGNIVGLATARQWSEGRDVGLLLVVAEAGVLAVFRTNDWTPCVRVHLHGRGPTTLPAAGGGGRALVVTSLAAYGATVALIGFSDGSLQARRVLVAASSSSSSSSTATKSSNFGRVAAGCLVRKLWPLSVLEAQTAFEPGAAAVLQCQPRWGRFLTRSESLGLLEWAVRPVARGDALNVALGDQLSRDAGRTARMRGAGDLTDATAAAYLDVCRAVVVASGHEVTLLAACDYDAEGWDHLGGLEPQAVDSCGSNARAEEGIMSPPCSELRLETAADVNRSGAATKYLHSVDEIAAAEAGESFACGSLTGTMRRVPTASPAYAYGGAGYFSAAEEALTSESRAAGQRRFARRLRRALEEERAAAETREQAAERRRREAAVELRAAEIHRLVGLGVVPTPLAISFADFDPAAEGGAVLMADSSRDSDVEKVGREADRAVASVTVTDENDGASDRTAPTSVTTADGAHLGPVSPAEDGGSIVVQSLGSATSTPAATPGPSPGRDDILLASVCNSDGGSNLSEVHMTSSVPLPVPTLALEIGKDTGRCSTVAASRLSASCGSRNTGDAAAMTASMFDSIRRSLDVQIPFSAPPPAWREISTKTAIELSAAPVDEHGLCHNLAAIRAVESVNCFFRGVPPVDAATIPRHASASGTLI